MTITHEHLIHAAKAMGVELYPSFGKQKLFTCGDGEPVEWNPEYDKAQLLDLIWKLKLSVMSGSRIVYDPCTFGNEHYFNAEFESFATAIILAAAEIGRGWNEKETSR